MKKSRISAVLATIFFGTPVAGFGAYPAYPTYQSVSPQTAQQRVVYQQPTQQRVYYPQQQQVIYQPQYQQQYQQQTIQANRTVAANPTRVTGQLPRVGSNMTNAGRQYYQPADYDRLADSGLYVGLSAGYSASINGGMGADYTGESKSFLVPGAFKEASYKSDTVIPLQLSIGASINNDVRVDFSYTRYSGLEYPQSVQTASDDVGGMTTASATGGAITSNATMLNVYYNIDSYTGILGGGAMRPYVGVGVGMAFNSISDYVVLDPTFYSEMDPSQAGYLELTGISDIYAYHSGGTKENLAYMLEGGITTELEGGMKLDFFVRYMGLGKVKTSGSIVVSQTEWVGDGQGGEVEASYDSVFHYTNWYESGNLGMVDVGVRLRLQF